MEKKEFHDSLNQGLNALGIKVSERECEKLYLYFAELKKWSRKINLIAKGTTDHEILDKHFLDSLVLLKRVESHDACLLDIGTGAGFPGLVCGIARPDMRVILVEPRLKRVSFLNHIVRSLGLEKLEVRAARIEDEEKVPSSEPITHATSRAVNEIGLFCKMVLRFGREDIKVVCMKGPKWQDELHEAKEQHGIEIDGYETTEISLPYSGSARVLVEFDLGNIQTT